MNLKLPLLEYVDKEFLNIDLSNCFLIAGQNILGSTETIMDHLLQKGMSPCNISIIGKVYSSSPQVIQNLTRKGIYISPYSVTFDPLVSFDCQYENYVREFVKLRANNIDINKTHKIIILDEGHKILEIAEDFFPRDKLIGIEQSTKTSFIKNLNFQFPCLSISRTKAKLFAESPLIADVVSDKLFSFFEETKLQVNNFLIIGNGFIGKALAATLCNLGYNVKIYDHNEHKSEIKDYELDDYLKQCHVIISCVYGSALKDHHYAFLSNNVVLANASLSDRAFKAVDIRKLYPNTIENCHQNISVDLPQGKLHLMNCGFPINFSGEIHSVPPNKIQITRALLLGAIYEGMLAPHQTTQALSLDLQNKILNAFFQFEPEAEHDYKLFLNSINSG